MLPNEPKCRKTIPRGPSHDSWDNGACPRHIQGVMLNVTCFVQEHLSFEDGKVSQNGFLSMHEYDMARVKLKVRSRFDHVHTYGGNKRTSTAVNGVTAVLGLC